MRVSHALVGLLGLLSRTAFAEEDATADAKDTLTEPEPEDIPIRGRSSGCDVEDFKFAATPGGESKTIKLGNERFFRITLPENYKHGFPAPLILAFHDQNMTAKDMEETSLLSSPAYNKDAIVVYPEAKEETRWMSDGNPSKVDDLVFVEAILDSLSSRLCVDEDRIYATGLGTGGGMSHLLACHKMSGRIAAFSLVNANILEGLLVDESDGQQMKDPTSLVWSECVPGRSPVRIQVIHAENNTVFDYWGKIRNENRTRAPTVKNLVEWATRNGCGMGSGYPNKWRGENDTVHKTLLEAGYIFEGFVGEDSIIKATYHCWAGDKSKAQKEAEKAAEEAKIQDAIKSANQEEGVGTDEDPSKEGVGTDEDPSTEEEKEEPEPEPEPEDTRTEEEKHAEELYHLERNQVHEHYLLRGLPHGWHRVEKIPKEPEPEEEIDDDDLVARFRAKPRPAPQWRSLEASTNYNPGLVDMSKNTSTLGYGFTKPISEPIRFDTTSRVLEFFRMYKLSDPPGTAPRNAKGLSESEQGMLDDMVAQISDAVEKAKAAKAMEEEEADGQVPIFESGIDSKEDNTAKSYENLVEEGYEEEEEDYVRAVDFFTEKEEEPEPEEPATNTYEGLTESQQKMFTEVAGKIQSAHDVLADLQETLLKEQDEQKRATEMLVEEEPKEKRTERMKDEL